MTMAAMICRYIAHISTRPEDMSMLSTWEPRCVDERAEARHIDGFDRLSGRVDMWSVVRHVGADSQPSHTDRYDRM